MHTPYPVRKQIAIRRVQDDALVEDLDKFSINRGCVDVDIMV